MDDTFVLTLTPETAWYIRGIVRPGMNLDYPDDSLGNQIDGVLRALRRKINHSILQMVDGKLKTVDVECSEDEAWIIDANVTYDGGGLGTTLLLDLFRGMHYLGLREDNSEPSP